MRYRPHLAFTLIELLVVVAIIAALIAILLPSLSKASYTARLTVCTSNLHQIGVGVLTYTAEYTGQYPFRRTAWSGNAPSTTNTGGDPVRVRVKQDQWDDRRMYRPYFDVNFLYDPFVPRENFDRYDLNIDTTVTPVKNIHGNYELFFGAAINRYDKSTWRLRLTDRPTAVDIDTGQRHTVRVIAGDMEWRGDPTYGFNDTSHPDLAAAAQIKQRLDSEALRVLWTSNQSTAIRGAIDRNFLYDDGSAKTLSGLGFVDDRLIKIPAKADLPNGPSHNFIPPN